jgi:hypothetical protein
MDRLEDANDKLGDSWRGRRSRTEAKEQMLALMCANPGATVGRLAELTGRSRPAIVQALKRLEEAGLVGPWRTSISATRPAIDDGLMGYAAVGQACRSFYGLRRRARGKRCRDLSKVAKVEILYCEKKPAFCGGGL